MVLRSILKKKQDRSRIARVTIFLLSLTVKVSGDIHRKTKSINLSNDFLYFMYNVRSIDMVSFFTDLVENIYWKSTTIGTHEPWKSYNFGVYKDIPIVLR